MATKKKKISQKTISAVMTEMGRKGGSVSNPKKGFGTTAKKAIAARWERWRAENPDKAVAAEERRRKRAAKTAVLIVTILLSARVVSGQSCMGKVQPIAPIASPGCGRMVPICSCVSRTECSWVWGCTSADGLTIQAPPARLSVSETSVVGGAAPISRLSIDPTIPLRVNPIHVPSMNVLGMYEQILRIKAFQQQAEAEDQRQRKREELLRHSVPFAFEKVLPPEWFVKMGLSKLDESELRMLDMWMGFFVKAIEENAAKSASSK